MSSFHATDSSTFSVLNGDQSDANADLGSVPASAKNSRALCHKQADESVV